MNNTDLIQFTWGNLLLAAIVFLVLYFVLRITSRFLSSSTSSGMIQESVASGIRYILLAYEPLVLLITGSIFILINPIFHGLISLLALIGGFNYLKNYVSGRVIQLDKTLSLGKGLSFQKTSGIITKLGRLGIQLKTGKGLQFIPYTELYSKGFMMRAGSGAGGFYTLNIKAETPDKHGKMDTYLTDMLATAPYLDKNHKLDILPDAGTPDQIKVKVMIKEETHLYELISLIREWGFFCKVSNK